MLRSKVIFKNMTDPDDTHQVFRHTFRTEVAFMAPVAEEDDSFVAGSIIVEDWVLYEGVSVADVPGLAFSARCGGTSVRAVQSRRAVRAVSKMGHMSPEGNKTTIIAQVKTYDKNTLILHLFTL